MEAVGIEVGAALERSVTGDGAGLVLELVGVGVGPNELSIPKSVGASVISSERGVGPFVGAIAVSASSERLVGTSAGVDALGLEVGNRVDSNVSLSPLPISSTCKNRTPCGLNNLVSGPPTITATP